VPLHACGVVATGFATLMPATPLSDLLSIGVPGCDVRVRGDILDMVETTNGVIDWQIFVPALPPIIGMHFYHQVMPIELDAQGGWVAVTATNALQLTAGIF
jgi:hypothetical protein